MLQKKNAADQIELRTRTEHFVRAGRSETFCRHFAGFFSTFCHSFSRHFAGHSAGHFAADFLQAWVFSAKSQCLLCFRATTWIVLIPLLKPWKSPSACVRLNVLVRLTQRWTLLHQLSPPVVSIRVALLASEFNSSLTIMSSNQHQVAKLKPSEGSRVWEGFPDPNRRSKQFCR